MNNVNSFHQYADLFPEAILIVSADGTILSANRSACNRLEKSVNGINGASLIAICSEPEEQLIAYLRACSRTTSFVPGKITFSHAESTPVAYRTEGALFAARTGDSPPQLILRLTPRDAAANRFMELNRQIAQLSREVARRQEAEIAVSEQRERLRVTLDSIGDCVIATDDKAVITFLNPTAETHTGWTSREAIGKHIEEVFNIVNETTRLKVECPAVRAIEEGIIVGLANHTILIRKDGSEIHIDDSGAPIRNTEGRIIGAVLVFHDISQRRELERKLAARTIQLEDEHRRKDEFLAMLGHELRNPLAPIKMALQLQEMPDSSPQLRTRSLNIMNRQVDHLTHLVDELLDVARISTGKITLQLETLEISSIVYRALELCEPLIQQKHHRLSTNLSSEPLYVLGDLQRLTQVIANLLNNAVKYTSAGGSIILSAHKKGGSVEILVQDNGMGIHPTLLPHIFEVFTQSERALARSEGGLGIGLALAKRLVEQHGGTISAKSDGVDKGSTFTIVLPASSPTTSIDTIASEKADAPAFNVKRKILVVDDNQDAAEILGEMLRMLGNDVETASTGIEAIEMADHFKPGLIFLDIGLPGMSGYEVAKILRSSPASAAIVLVALTGYGQAEDIRRSREAGFSDHLVKPVDIKRIKNILASFQRRLTE